MGELECESYTLKPIAWGEEDYCPRVGTFYAPEFRSGIAAYNEHLFLFHFHFRYRQYVFYSRLDVQMRNVFGVDTPALAELERSAVLALINVNFAMDYAEPLPPNVIPVAGLHIKDAKPLPADIESFINASKSGAILFSLGSNFRSDSMNLHTQKMFINAFRQLPDYHFLWKFESEMVSSQLPKNVLIRPWLPQSNILAHPKTKLFLTHAGLLSTQEAIWRGVPMLGMPFIFDQHIVNNCLVQSTSI